MGREEKFEACIPGNQGKREFLLSPDMCAVCNVLLYANAMRKAKSKRLYLFEASLTHTTPRPGVLHSTTPGLSSTCSLSFMCVVQMRLMFPPRLIKDDENGKKR